jgi:glycosyltransferase involved in cell wall biosynthesis
MRIGIDGKWFFSGNSSGREVVRNLIQSLCARHPEHEFFIFLHRRDRRHEFPCLHANMHLEYIGGRINLLANLFFLPLRGNALRLDVVVCQYFAPGFSRFRRVVYIHDAIFKTRPDFFPFWQRCYFMPMRFLSRRAHLVIAVSQAERRRLEALGFAQRGRIEVVANGVGRDFRPLADQDPEGLRRVSERYSLPDSFLLYVGRMSARKNICGLLAAFAQLGDGPVQLVLAGSWNNGKASIGKMIKACGLEKRVHCFGWVPCEDLPPLYALARGFAYLSFDEGFGLPMLEALASGVPAVVSDIEVMHEVCGDAALFADPRDPAAIAALLRRVLADDPLRRELRRRGRAQAAKFRWENSADRLLGLIMNLK